MDDSISPYRRITFGSLFIFLISIFLSIALLITERFFGIGWDYHPDARTYIETSEKVVKNVLDGNFLFIFNQMFFFVSWGLNNSISAIISFNIIIFSLTNVLLVNNIYSDLEKRQFNKPLLAFLVLLIVASPYRVHLSIHVLKDTLIIFFLVSIYISLFHLKIMRYFKNLFKILLLISLRTFGIVYLVPSLRFYSKLALAILTLVLLLIFSEQILDYLTLKNELDLNFREYDSVPSFTNYGLLGMIIRMVLWPLFVFTGSFILFSPSLPLFIMSVGSMGYFIFSAIAFRKLPVTFWVFGVLSVVAALVPGFTSYIRYCYPILVIVPLIHINYLNYRYSSKFN